MKDKTLLNLLGSDNAPDLVRAAGEALKEIEDGIVPHIPQTLDSLGRLTKDVGSSAAEVIKETGNFFTRFVDRITGRESDKLRLGMADMKRDFDQTVAQLQSQIISRELQLRRIQEECRAFVSGFSGLLKAIIKALSKDNCHTEFESKFHSSGSVEIDSHVKLLSYPVSGAMPPSKYTFLEDVEKNYAYFVLYWRGDSRLRDEVSFVGDFNDWSSPIKMAMVGDGTYGAYYYTRLPLDLGRDYSFKYRSSLSGSATWFPPDFGSGHNNLSYRFDDPDVASVHVTYIDDTISPCAAGIASDEKQTHMGSAETVKLSKVPGARGASSGIIKANNRFRFFLEGSSGSDRTWFPRPGVPFSDIKLEDMNSEHVMRK